MATRSGTMCMATTLPSMNCSAMPPTWPAKKRRYFYPPAPRPTSLACSAIASAAKSIVGQGRITIYCNRRRGGPRQYSAAADRRRGGWFAAAG